MRNYRCVSNLQEYSLTAIVVDALVSLAAPTVYQPASGYPVSVRRWRSSGWPDWMGERSISAAQFALPRRASCSRGSGKMAFQGSLRMRVSQPFERKMSRFSVQKLPDSCMSCGVRAPDATQVPFPTTDNPVGTGICRRFPLSDDLSQLAGDKPAGTKPRLNTCPEERSLGFQPALEGLAVGGRSGATGVRPVPQGRFFSLDKAVHELRGTNKDRSTESIAGN